MRRLHKESLRVILLDTRYHLIRIEEVSIGSVNESIAHPRDVFRPAVVSSAYAVIVVHNHPSGDSSPSQTGPRLNKTIGGGCGIAANQTARPHHYRCAERARRRLFQFQRSRRAVKIHPTAIVDPGAQVGSDVQIGPYSVIGRKR